MKFFRPTFFALHVSTCLAFCIDSIQLQRPLGAAVERPRAPGDVKWSYFGKEGPLVWHKLGENNDFQKCGTGTKQSPINLASNAVDPRAYPIFQVPESWDTFSAFNLTNTGHGVQVTPGGMIISHPIQDLRTNALYVLEQFHFHTPSEHVQDGEYYPLEVHAVFHNQQTRTPMVIGIFFELSNTQNTTFVPAIVEYLPQITIPHRDVPIQRHLLTDLFRMIQLKYETIEYQGSLTTPPCTEGVRWVVFTAKSTFPLSVHDYNALKKFMGFNSRFALSNYHDDATGDRHSLIDQVCSPKRRDL